jgi:hypothetical protein
MSVSTILSLILLVSTVDSGNFAGGTITWRFHDESTVNASIAVVVMQTYLWMYAIRRCDNASIANRQPVSGTGGSITCWPSCPAGFGLLSAQTSCTDLSVPNAQVVGQYSDVVWIPAQSNFSILCTSTSWNSLILGAGAWSLGSNINLIRRSDNGLINNSPVASVMSPVYLYSSWNKTITITVVDADGDAI